MLPLTPLTTLRTAWTNVREKAKVLSRWHDNRHTSVTESRLARVPGDESDHEHRRARLARHALCPPKRTVDARSKMLPDYACPERYMVWAQGIDGEYITAATIQP